MKVLNSGNVVRLALDEIVIGNRLRQVSDVQVENLLLMAQDTGITTPIHCRKSVGRYELIDGAHRLAAARRLGQADIAALLVECRQDEARAMEASNNLGAARMSPVQTAVFAASWKRDYYAMHPERKPGVFKGNQHSGNVVEDIMSLTRSVADAFAITERHARRILAVGERLSSEESALLDGSAARIGLADLVQLSKVGDPDERGEVVRALAEGKKAAPARRAFAAAKNGHHLHIRSPSDQKLLALISAWARAGKVERRKFIEEAFGDLSPLVADEAGRRQGPASE